MEWHTKRRCELPPSLSYHVDGLKIYSIKSLARAELLKSLRDGQSWKKDTKTQWKNYDRVRYKNCGGCLCCPNNHYDYKVILKRPNNLNFDKYERCTVRGTSGVNLKFKARKYTAYISETEADFFQYRAHSCEAIIQSSVAIDVISETIRIDPSIKPLTI